MKKKSVELGALLLAVALLWYFLKIPTLVRPVPPAQNSAISSSGDTNLQSLLRSRSEMGGRSSAGTVSNPPANLGGIAVETLPSLGPVADLPPETVLRNVRRAVRQYGEMFGGDPVGTNPEITGELSGHNPKHIDFIDPRAGMRINGQGELIDQWDTPYFFHQLSGTEMEIHSAGPDRIMWTADDLVTQ